MDNCIKPQDLRGCVKKIQEFCKQNTCWTCSLAVDIRDSASGIPRHTCGLQFFPPKEWHKLKPFRKDA